MSWRSISSLLAALSALFSHAAWAADAPESAPAPQVAVAVLIGKSVRFSAQEIASETRNVLETHTQFAVLPPEALGTATADSLRACAGDARCFSVAAKEGG